MRIISVGDIHGKDYWKIIDLKKYDKIIFVGDYVDAFDIGNIDMKQNLLDIIQLKKDYIDKVVLLIGNHDIQYSLGYPEYGCSGYRPEMAFDFGDIFRQNKDLFQMAFQIDDYLWTHAGVHTGWYKFRLNKILKEEEILHLTLSEQLNYLFERRYEVLFDVGHLRGGYHSVGGPFWLDKRNGHKKPLEGYHQIVGHTRLDDIQTFNINNDTSITFIDVLDKDSKSFYVTNLK